MGRHLLGHSFGPPGLAPEAFHVDLEVKALIQESWSSEIDTLPVVACFDEIAIASILLFP
jgi:hypothetical protein